MSKQSEAKLAQGYELTTFVPNCGNCSHLQSYLVVAAGDPAPSNQKPNNHRCGIGGFAVKKTATCKQWDPKG